MTDLAHEAYQDVLWYCHLITAQRLIIASRLYHIQKDRIYNDLGYSSLNELLGDPEISMSQSEARDLISIHKTFAVDLKIEPKELSMAGIRKLKMILPVVESDPDHWLSMAKTLSRSDLQEEVNAAVGTRAKPKKKSPPSSPVSPAISYEEYVETSPCCVCGKSPVDKAHFPKTRGAGGLEWHVIPLCRECHREQHDGGKEWLWMWRNKITNFFFETIDKFGGKE